MDENVTKCGMGEQYNLHFVFHLVDAFLLRDAIHSADHAVCLSVCLSVKRRYSVQTAKQLSSNILSSGSHSILVFPHQTV